MADSISNTPRSGALGWLADALSTARNAGDRLDLKRLLPQFAQDRLDAEPWGAGSAFLGKTPEALNEMSYGSMPMRVPPTSNIPQFQTSLPVDEAGNRVQGPAVSRADSTLDALFAAQGIAPLAKAAGPAAKALGRAGAVLADSALQPVPRSLAQQGAIRLKGGNTYSENIDQYLGTLGVGADEFGRMGQARFGSTKTWGGKQLRNYISKDLGSPTDPLLAVEKDHPDLHYPAGHLTGAEPVPDRYHYALRGRPGIGYDAQREILAKHAELTGTPPLDPKDIKAGNVDVQAYFRQPGALTPWGEHSSGAMGSLSPKDYGLELSEYGQDAPAWLDKAPADTKIWSVADPEDDHLGFSHVLDYLDTAQQPSLSMRGLHASEPQDVNIPYRTHSPAEAAEGDAYLAKVMAGANDEMHPFPQRDVDNWRALHNAGLTLTPEQVAKTSVADAVRKTAQWNQFMANRETEGSADLGRGIAGVHKDYGDGMKWVKLGLTGEAPKVKLGADGMPEGWTLSEDTPDSINAATGRPWNHPEDTQYGEINTHPWRIQAPDNFSYDGGRFGRSLVSKDEAIKRAQFVAQEKLDMAHRSDLEAGLNAEGEAMGHCVGGYCDEVANNGTSIYSLRDAKNNPQVTVETRPSKPAPWDPLGWVSNYGKKNGPSEQALADLGIENYRIHGADYNAIAAHPEYQAYKAQNIGAPESIEQIKGKQNAAPVDKYLPYVQDFVKNGQWGRVGDFRNTGLFDLTKGNPVRNEFGTGTMARDEAKWDMYMKANPNAKYASKQDVLDHVASQQEPPAPADDDDVVPGYAHGGSVVPRYSNKAKLLARLGA